MITSTTCKVDLDKINIPKNFSKKLPSTDKITARLRFYRATGEFDRQILIDERNNLIDGYTTYLVCKMLGIEKVPALRIKVSFETGELFEMLRDKVDALMV